MLEILPLFCLAGAFCLLILLTVIDSKTMLLPNIYVAPFALLGLIFHWSTDFHLLSLAQIALGGIGSYTLLYLIRMAGNKYYGQDSLGLGDVKLLAAGGLWIGLMGVIYAMTIGAAFTVLFGLTYAAFKALKYKAPFNLSRLTIPAGPGFIIGLMIIAGWQYKGAIVSLFYTVFA